MDINNNATGTRRRNVLLFAISFAGAFLLTLIAREPGFTQAQVNVIFLLLFSIGLWLTEAVPAFAVGILIIAFLVFSFGFPAFTNDPQDIKIYLNTFSSPVIWLMLGGFFLASAMTKTKLDLDLIKITLRVCGNNPKWILFGMMGVTMVASMLISNTATTAMVVAALMPLLTKLGKGSATGKGLLLGIPIAATTGGMGTMIGSPPNAVTANALAAVGSPVDFIHWIFYGLPLAVVLTVAAWLVLTRMFMKDAQPVALEFDGAHALEKDLRSQRRIVLFMLFATLILWFSSPWHGLSSAAVSAVPLVGLTLFNVLDAADVKAMGWDTLILLAGGLSLGIGLQQTGLLDIYASKISSLDVPGWVFYFLLAYATMVFSNIMSSTATSTVLIPLGMAIMPEHKAEAAMIIGLATSTALFLPVSTPPNAIVHSTGLVSQKDFRIGGALIGLLGPALIVLWVLAIS